MGTTGKLATTCAGVITTLLISASAFSRDFKGYPCTVDCSGHEAGYEWAEQHGLDDESDCGGNSNSFYEGCQSYVEEQKSGDDDDTDDGGEK